MNYNVDITLYDPLLQRPKENDEVPGISIEVLTVDETGCSEIVYYDYETKMWEVLTRDPTNFGDPKIKWFWYYFPVTRSTLKNLK